MIHAAGMLAHVYSALTKTPQIVRVSSGTLHGTACWPSRCMPYHFTCLHGSSNLPSQLEIVSMGQSHFRSHNLLLSLSSPNCGNTKLYFVNDLWYSRFLVDVACADIIRSYLPDAACVAGFEH